MSAAAEVASEDSNAGGIAGVMVVGWFLWGGMWTVIWLAFAINHMLKNRRRSQPRSHTGRPNASTELRGAMRDHQLRPHETTHLLARDAPPEAGAGP